MGLGRRAVRKEGIRNGLTSRVRSGHKAKQFIIGSGFVRERYENLFI